MECDIIVEGFCKSEEQHGLRYTNFIGDGDSAVFSTLKREVKKYGFAITKEECANHAVKCFRSALENLVKDKPQYKGRNKLTEAQQKQLASAVRCTIAMRSKQVANNEMDRKEAAKQLQEDILNAALHCFGSHHKCKADYCKTIRAIKASTGILQPSHSPAESSTSLALSQDTSVGDSSSDNSYDSSSFLSSSTNSEFLLQDSSTPSTSTIEPPAAATIEGDMLTTILLDQQTAWENTIAVEQTDDSTAAHPISLDPEVPLDHQMICDIQKLASRLAAKSAQLLGMKAQSHRLCQ